jgi:hypothetical protein
MITLFDTQFGKYATVHGLDDLHTAAGDNLTVCPCHFINAKIHSPYDKTQHQYDDAPDKPCRDSAT